MAKTEKGRIVNRELWGDDDIFVAIDIYQVDSPKKRILFVPPSTPPPPLGERLECLPWGRLLDLCVYTRAIRVSVLAPESMLMPASVSASALKTNKLHTRAPSHTRGYGWFLMFLRLATAFCSSPPPTPRPSLFFI